MFKKYTLKNGACLIIAPRSETKAVTIMLGIAAGSRYEDEKVAGISHLCEHMFFKGSKKRPTPKLVSDFINDIGGMCNAYTDKELTAYHVKISSNHLLEVLDYLSDNLINPLNLEEEFNREKNVVIEDVKMHKDRPMEEVFELFEEEIFSEKSLGQRIAGTVKAVSGISLSDLKQFEKDHYVAENLVISIAGNLGGLNENDVVALVEKYFTISSGQPQIFAKSGTADKPVLAVDKRRTEQTNLIVGFGGPGIRDEEDKYAFRLLAGILGGSSSSRMFVEVREKRGLAYAAETAYQGYSDVGSILTLANVANENVKEAAEAIVNVYRIIREENPSEGELSRVKEMMKSAFLIGLEDSEDVAEMLMRMEIIQGKLITPDEIIARYESVTADDIRRVAKKYLDFGKMVISAVGPNINKQELNKILMR